jgi:hypothetical protein
MNKIIVTFVTVLAVAVFSGSAAARILPIEPTNPGQPVELVWGHGALPRLVPARITRRTQPQRVTRADLRRVIAARQIFALVTGGRTIPR